MRQYQDIGNVVGNVALDGIAISVLTDCDDVVRMVGGSRAFARLFDIDPEECEGLPLSELTGRLGFPLPWRSPQANEVVVWSESDGPRNIVVMRRSALDTLIDGVRKTWEVRVFQDVTQARRREEGLAVAFEQALGEARGKAEFLANISHELRTPLNAVLGYAEVISGQMFGPDAAVKYSEYATDIHSAGAHLLALIDHLLMVSEIEAEKRVLHVTQFDLGELVAECARWVAEQPGPAKPEISVNRPAEGLMVEADAVAMYQVTINLIGNAAKFTPPSGHVSVTVMVDAMGGPVLSVKDDGPGVSPELIADLFQPFRQGEGVYARRHGGVGLGLSIVKGLIQLHGGTVRMISQLGHGAEVIARLPPTLRV
jgi:signal transduction histidine kinase